ncbi:hypothetical protein EWM64_g10937 [Hericium alpestre]|uniref:Uncharacterized protein n=1 Tax=Hericium alpestre TaxID=135208 RepID=A0A4Y9ZE69_9AGAM|nr:hypothetical protein EWM64_g10937 [Hericium alpestre]
MSQTRSVEQLKERANQKVKQGVYTDALQLYTRALDSATGETSRELQRQILSNRAQTYLSWGDIYTALADTERALSAEYTQADSDKDLTAKYRFRRAKLLNIFCRYEEARAELEELRKIRDEQGQAVDDVVRELLQDVEKALRAPAGSRARQKADLLRAVDVSY